MSDAPSILSLRLSRAYGAPLSLPRAAGATAPAITPAAPRPQSKLPDAAQRLFAATVPGGITFDDATGTPTPTRDAIPMYRHPADRNAAAVAIEIGRAIDVRG